MLDNTNQILRLPKVKEMTGLSRSSIYAAVAKGLFPAPIHLSQRTVGWVREEVQNWLDSRMAARQHKGVE